MIEIRFVSAPARWLGNRGPLVALVALAAIPLAFLPIGDATTSAAVRALEVPKEILVKLAAALLVVTAAVRWRRGEPLTAPSRAVLAILGTFTACYALAAVASADRTAAFAAMQQIGVFVIFTLAAICIPGVSRLGLVGLGIAGVIVSLMVTGQELGLELWGWREVGSMVQPAASFMHRNRAAYLIALAIPLALGWRSRWSYAALPILATGLLFTRCRGAWLAAIIGAVALVVFDRAMRRAVLARCAVIVATAALVTVASWSTVPPGGQGADTFEVRIAHDYGSVGARWKLWHAAVAVIGEHPLLGAGPGQFAAAAAPHHAGPVPSAQADDELLATASEAGLPAAACLGALALLAVATAMRGIRRDGARYPAVLAALALALMAASVPEALIRQGAYSAVAGIVLGAALAGVQTREVARW